MQTAPQPMKTSLRSKLKLLAKASLWAAWYSAAAFVIILIMTAIYDDQMLNNMQVTALNTAFFFVALEAVWLISLMVIGLPLWILLEKLGFIRKIHARLFGMLPPLLCGLLLVMNLNFMQPWKLMIPVSLGYIGNLIGKYIWKKNYKQVAEITHA